MSFLAEEIERQMTVQNLDQTTVAQRAGMSQGQISKWRNNVQTTIDTDQMHALQLALSADPDDHASLIRAHLRDEAFGHAADRVTIEVAGTHELQDRPRPRTKGERAMAFLAESRIESKDVNDLLIDLARCLGAQDL